MNLDKAWMLNMREQQKLKMILKCLNPSYNQLTNCCSVCACLKPGTSKTGFVQVKIMKEFV